MPTLSPDLPRRPRISSLDWLRGLVMVIMLIDHTRDFVHAESMWHSATDLSTISSATFLTRWITHFCAPTFVFLAGAGIALQLQAGKSLASVQRFLWTRGVWLVILEFTLVRLGWDFRWNPWVTLGTAQVIWVLGLSMILLAALIRLPRGWLLAFGLLLVAGHNALDTVVLPVWHGPGTPNPGALSALWVVLHQGRGMVAPFGGMVPRFHVFYPLIPWPGVMALGFCLGRVFQEEPELRRRTLARLGLLVTAAFVVLRAVNLYGDASRWTVQPNLLRTALSFVNTTKYPPSLLYLLMTLGPALLLLAWREGRTDNRFDGMLVTFGRVPMFYYVLQTPVAHGLGVLLAALAGNGWRYVAWSEGPKLPNAGFSLEVTYLAWAAGVALLYPLCRWFAGVKARRKDWWLSYL